MKKAKKKRKDILSDRDRAILGTINTAVFPRDEHSMMKDTLFFEVVGIMINYPKP